MSGLTAWGRSTGACALLLLAVACGKDPVDRGEPADGGVSVAPSRDAGKKPNKPADICLPSNPYCQDKPPSAAPSCGNAAVNLDPVGVNVMVAIDGRASMAPHWQLLKEAVSSLHDAHPTAKFGVHVFWGAVQDGLDNAMAKANWCGATESHFLDVGTNTAQQLTDLMGEMPPGPSFLGGLWETTPVVDPLDYYLKNATKLADPTRTNYLLLISDGNDNCFGSVFTNQENKLLAYEKIAVELGKRDIRVVPIGFDAASAATINSIYGYSPPRTNLDVLGALLKNGGSGLKDVPTVDDPLKFADVLDQVGLRVRSCRFTIPATTAAMGKVNPFELTFAINGTAISRDRTNTNGWNFVGGDIQQVELFGDACDAVRSGAALSSQKSCAGESCGSAALEVKTKPRAVLHLLDSSASRIECVNGSFDCLYMPGAIGRTSFTYWEVVEYALGKSLAEPINDDVEFGLQFFPDKNASEATFSCTVAAAPEIPPALSTQIQIMSRMFEKLPLGRSPQVAALESVAANPGRLADPGVQGAVVMLTDGGDNCAEDPAQIVARLSAAARSLLDKGVKTYVVRYGSQNGKTPEQEEQLRAIVANGGTASSDPADPALTPYIDAVDDTALTAALAALSDKLATCEINVGQLPENADRDKANLYLNGVVVPQETDARQDGWGWSASDPSTIELHGPSCEEFKTSRKTSVIVEFGCQPIVVI